MAGMVAALGMLQRTQLGEIPFAVVPVQPQPAARKVDDVDRQTLSHHEADEGLVPGVQELMGNTVGRATNEVSGADPDRALADGGSAEPRQDVHALLFLPMRMEFRRCVTGRHRDEVHAYPGEARGVPEGLVYPDRVRMEKVHLPRPLEPRDVVRTQIHVSSAPRCWMCRVRTRQTIFPIVARMPFAVLNASRLRPMSRIQMACAADSRRLRPP